MIFLLIIDCPCKISRSLFPQDNIIGRWGIDPPGHGLWMVRDWSQYNAFYSCFAWQPSQLREQKEGLFCPKRVFAISQNTFWPIIFCPKFLFYCRILPKILLYLKFESGSLFNLYVIYLYMLLPWLLGKTPKEYKGIIFELLPRSHCESFTVFIL